MSAGRAPRQRLEGGELQGLAWALLASLVLWHLPFGGLVLYPFKLLATWMHELSHGIVMTLTATGFDRMEVYRDGSGLAYARGGAAPVARAVIAAAGYMGTPVFGVAMLLAGRTAAGARRILLALGGLLGFTSVVVVANDFGRGAVGLMAALVLIAALVLPARARVAATTFLAAQACVNAVLDIRVLYRPVLMVDGKAMGGSDAHNMAAATFGTSADWAVWTWASIWLAWSLLLFYLVLRIVRRPARVLVTADRVTRSDSEPAAG